MPFLVAQLPSTLNQVSSLGVESTSTVRADVANSKKYTHPSNPKPGKPPPAQPKTPAVLNATPNVSLRPIELLQTLGLAMLPPQHVQQHLASWHWTLLRYAYLIEPKPDGSPLETNALAGDYRFHHMTALSEAVGVGCALSYAQRWLGAQIPADVTVHDPIDFEYLIGANSVPLPGEAASLTPQAAANTDRRPDYLVVAERDDGYVQLLVVECKGTSSSRAVAIGQLGSAMHQLAGVVFAGSSAGPLAVHKHAYSAQIARDGAAIKLYGIDPPEEGERWVRPSVPPRGDKEGLGAHYDEQSLVLPTPEEVSGRFLRRIEQRAFAWAGAGDGPHAFDIEGAPRRNSQFGEVVGTTSSLILPTGQTVEIFTGALDEVLQAARDPDPERPRVQRTAARRGQASLASEPRSADRLEPDEDPERVASVLNDDGLALRIEVK